ncbi:MAG: AlwI family type II restriction endonuclease [Prevotella sp.]|nr:AlwI family type II restriction endonuclease [Prevotella sp.]
MTKKQDDGLFYSTYFWSLGTTSFRTKKFNNSIERLLGLLDEFWKDPHNKDYGWEEVNESVGQKDIYEIKDRFYYFMRDNGFTTGDDQTPYKAAREKTSGLVDIGLINSEHRLTEVGRRILDMSKSNEYRSQNPLRISQDSYIYLKQLLKTSVKIKELVVRPFVVLIYMLERLGYLTTEEFTYLAPLCISENVTAKMADHIDEIRKGNGSVNDLIVEALMARPNYQSAYNVWMEGEVSEALVMKIGVNRKSRKYDKPYYPLFLMLREVFLEGKIENAHVLYKLTQNISNVGGQWRALLFDTPSVKAIKKDPKAHLNESAFSHVRDDNDLKEVFFKTLHTIKAKATLHDYYDLNRRYLGIANVILFEDGLVKLDLVPKQFFASAIDDLYNFAYKISDELEHDCKIEEICPALKFDEKDIVARLSAELKIELKTIDEAYLVDEKLRYDRFKTMVDTRFTNDDLLGLLDDFDNRNDDEISKKVTDNADTPTIFEYILGIIWYKVSGYKGRILDYMKLSLDANLLPITHAAGGEADIVYEYGETQDYPAHTLLLEATLADSTNQRRMEMEPVSRHLGNYILRTNNKNSYCLFATNYLALNVISDFRMRKMMPYYDPQNKNRSINGMKIIPLQTSDLRAILMLKKSYKDLYQKYDNAYQKDFSVMPVDWYDLYISETIKSLRQIPQIAHFADDMMNMNNGISILSLQRACIEKFGEELFMEPNDWYNAVRAYMEEKTSRQNLRDDEEVTWLMAAETCEFAPLMVTD